MDARLLLESVTFRYDSAGGDVPVFEDVTLALVPGEVLVLLGPNGTGKSTLLKCMAGLLRPQRGRVLLDGMDVSALAPSRLARRIGYVPQSNFSTFPFKVRDVVVMGRAPHLNTLESPSPRDVEIARAVIEDMGIAHMAERSCHQISAGEWQMVLIARALAQQPDVLLFDEPTSHLDIGNQVRILDHIRRLAGRGFTIVMASHVPDHGFMAGDRVAILKDRHLMALGRAEEVITSETLRIAYGVEVRVADLRAETGRRVCVPMLRG
jgi:ABC-type cobalamin/Fe3+-siderophores transport system ATPase subunit